ncbi:hypothetical protein [Mesorhizobium sp.]|uniref:hypothetical protein n=1 Tax=Mesorhizobium sp. TaxID=1871066 RepID=UPI0025DD5AF7|nr:hypothetical protein [Mesorhizobium sp.]
MTIDNRPVPSAGTGDPNAHEQSHDSTPRASTLEQATPGCDSPDTGIDKSIHRDGADQAATMINTLIAACTSTGGINAGPNGLAEAAARIGIHLDGTFSDTVTGYGSGHRAGLPDTTYPAISADAASNTGTTATASALNAANALGADPVFETRVATAGDDVEEKGSGSISTNINDLELGFDSSTRQTVGLRFTGIDIPQGAIITSAYIQFQANEVKTGAASLLIKGQDTDDASAFTSTSFNVSSRATTDASTAWTPAPWTTVGEQALAERTPDLTAIVQEIVSRSGWAALNDMAFLITGTGTRTADSYEYNLASAPLLHIEYVLPGSGSPVAFNTPPDSTPAPTRSPSSPRREHPPGSPLRPRIPMPDRPSPTASTMHASLSPMPASSRVRPLAHSTSRPSRPSI